MSTLRYSSAFVFCAAATLLVAGCGGGGGGGGDGGGGAGTARATILFSADETTRSADAVVMRGSGGGPVPIEDIESLFVTVTEVVLQRCDDDDDDDDADNLETVLVKDYEFDPSSVTIDEGGMVRWVWTEDTPHTITSGLIGSEDAGSDFDEAASEAGDVIEIVFEDVGDYPYFSDTSTDIAEGMAGIVHVRKDDDDDDDDDGDDDDDDDRRHLRRGDDDDDDDDGGGEHVTVFEGAVDVNILDLTQLSEVLSTVDVSAGEYCRIIIRIANPRLVLTSDPGTVITNVHLTANGRLFIKDHFTLNEGDEVLIIVSFGSIHLVEAGNSGRYVLTPQLRAEVDVIEAAVAIEGTIESVDDLAQIITVRTDSEELYEVFADGTTVIHSDDDADDPATGVDVTLGFIDLEVGQEVVVQGLLTVGGQIEADDIAIADASIVTGPI